MVEIFCISILDKRTTFDKVPAQIKPQVEKRLRELGYDTNGRSLED